MPCPWRIGRPKHILFLQWLAVNGADTRAIRPFLYGAVRCLYNLGHCVNSNKIAADFADYTDYAGCMPGVIP